VEEPLFKAVLEYVAGNQSRAGRRARINRGTLRKKLKTLRPGAMTIRRALLSVSNKDGLIEFARALHQRGIALLSTGGTATLLERSGVAWSTGEERRSRSPARDAAGTPGDRVGGPRDNVTAGIAERRPRRVDGRGSGAPRDWIE
jgi:hypothetical protein